MIISALLFGLVLSPAASDKATPLLFGETFTINSKILNEIRRINVYLPPSYAETPTTRLPVLYMPDGGIAEDSIAQAAEAGADAFVAGTAVYGADDPAAAARNLRRLAEQAVTR